ncbi:NAD-dependent protein deacylase [Apiospora aurea]|uniref:NAD-dependent protein deacylase n=1 Tax=Apiospora aurea TaxID=335848 RepID=A0ABR1QWG5_9PEZI
MPKAYHRPCTDIAEFQRLLKHSDRVLALCGAGLSAASGLPTFRGAGGLWRNHQATSLATPEAFKKDPALVWLFYAWRRHMALQAKPNAGHYALAELAKHNKDFMCLTQNVDGLSQRAGHSPDMLRMLHGNIFDVKCFDKECDYIEPNNLNDPLPPPKIKREDLPHCPTCKAAGKTSLLRPGIVWFGEALDSDMLKEVDAWVAKPRGIDIMLVIGTAAAVYPAAGYTDAARKKGARVAVINPDRSAQKGLTSRDFYFEADAAEILPKLFEGIIGQLEVPGQAA